MTDLTVETLGFALPGGRPINGPIGIGASPRMTRASCGRASRPAWSASRADSCAKMPLKRGVFRGPAVSWSIKTRSKPPANPSKP